MSVQSKAIKQIKAAAKTTKSSTPVAKPVANKAEVKPAKSTEMKAKKFTEEQRLAKNWRRATFSSDRSKYSATAHKDSIAWVRDRVSEGKTTTQITELIDQIRVARRQREADAVVAAQKQIDAKATTPARKAKKSVAKN